MIIYLATANEDKVREFSSILVGGRADVELKSANTIGGMPEVEETEDSFESNARLKANALREIAPFDGWVLADDSGLEVDALGGKPGVLSARYAGESASYEENNEKLLGELAWVSEENRSARFVCCLVLLGPSDEEQIFRGVCEGAISDRPQGGSGFGYDPLFVPAGYSESFAELGSKVKDAISHRARAIEALVGWLK